MIGIDTNLLVRYITQDGPEAVDVARHLEQHCTSDNPGFITIVCLCELVWVLDRAYTYSRASICAILTKLLETEQFEIESVEWVWRSIRDYEAGPADFSDYIIAHACKNHGATPVHTLDRKAARSKLFYLVPTTKDA